MLQMTCESYKHTISRPVSDSYAEMAASLFQLSFAKARLGSTDFMQARLDNFKLQEGSGSSSLARIMDNPGSAGLASFEMSHTNSAWKGTK
jgi:hypothetical protein